MDNNKDFLTFYEVYADQYPCKRHAWIDYHRAHGRRVYARNVTTGEIVRIHNYKQIQQVGNWSNWQAVDAKKQVRNYC